MIHHGSTSRMSFFGAIRPQPRPLRLMEELWSHSTLSETFLNNTLLSRPSTSCC